jgi:HEAT repeat protein
VYDPSIPGAFPMRRFAALVLLVAAGSAMANPLDAALRQLRDGNDEEKATAVRTIKALGPAGAPAIPALAEAVKDGPPALRTEIARLLGGFGPAAREAIPALAAAVQEPRADRALFTAAADAVAALGEPGNPDVVRACLHDESWGRGGKSVAVVYPEYLARHAPATVPTMAELLADADRRTRKRAAISLALLAAPTGGKPAVLAGLSRPTRDVAATALRAALDDPDLGTRAWAAAGLLNLDRDALPVAAPVLLTAAGNRDADAAQVAALVRCGTPAARLIVDYLDEPDPNGRQGIAGCLNQFGDAALPAIADGLRHPSPRVRAAVLRTISYAGRAAKLRAGVVARLRDPDPQVRLAAAGVLVAADPKRADAAVPVLAGLAFERNPSVRVEALADLRQLGPAARPAVPALLRRLRSGAGDTRLGAAEALKAADPTTWRSFVPVFVRMLKSESRWDRLRSITALRDTGPDAGSALPALRERFADEDPLNRVLAAEAVYRIDPETVSDAVDCLISVLKDPGAGGRAPYRQRRAAIRVFDKIGPPARAAAPALVELVRADPGAGFAPEAAVVAIRLDPDHAGEAYDFFRFHLSPGNPDADEQWLYAIGQLKKLARPLLPDLIAALGSKHATQRDGALDALAVLGPDAREALPALREMVKANKEHRRAAEVIAAIEK